MKVKGNISTINKTVVYVTVPVKIKAAFGEPTANPLDEIAMSFSFYLHEQKPEDFTFGQEVELELEFNG